MQEQLNTKSITLAWSGNAFNFEAELIDEVCCNDKTAYRVIPINMLICRLTHHTDDGTVDHSRDKVIKVFSELPPLIQSEVQTVLGNEFLVPQCVLNGGWFYIQNPLVNSA